MLYATMRIGNNCEYFLFQSNKECHFGRIDIDQAGEDIATKYGVNTLPTTLIIKNNKIVAKAVGLIREETLRALVNQYKA